MELFWMLAGVLITVAALVLLLPWLRSIPRLGPLPSVPWPAAVGAAVVLALVIGMYLKFGRPDVLNVAPSTAAALPATAAAPGAMGNGTATVSAATKSAAGSMNSAIAGLEARLAKGGGTSDDWELLAKSFEFLHQPANAKLARAHQLPVLTPDNSADSASAASGAPAPAAAVQLSSDSRAWLEKAAAARKAHKLKDAAAIYAQLASREQLDADGWADYADTAASLAGNRLAGQPTTYIDRALALNPSLPKALWLKASAAEELGQYDQAVVLWQRLQATLAPDSADAKIVAANLQAAQKQVAPAAVPAGSASNSAVAVSGEVALDASLNARAAPGTTLFIVAKSVDSPGMPVAVFRGTVGAWPVKFKLDDSLAMMPGRNLSSAGRITVEARISRSGQAMPASGDLQGSSGIINPAAAMPLKIVIDKVIS